MGVGPTTTALATQWACDLSGVDKGVGEAGADGCTNGCTSGADSVDMAKVEAVAALVRTLTPEERRALANILLDRDTRR